ncbi:hypothetical protein SA496_12065 [Pseudomonas sp. JS3066]|jgi:hypothetical protein|uniref:hypothetical protein n=1 Tax=unclassified Pseudomonas TaxID=196821 RepID=UPI000EA8B34F|nr:MULTISPECIES: hypothetical protein [unclassified Pseudomonas]AYF86671.1 hypothetical protein D6Z43_05655 [Pseudomonas sp. DY-1]MDH4653566.1 hypothetical protein [Pseudomonas sp. BN606]WVK95858.1 hypothetical protein SA496_12065 [Pseudomonas sp. JS3066]
MSLTVMILTRPLAAAAIEQIISQCLPGVAWTLQSISAEGCAWRLHLCIDPCAEPVCGMFSSIVANEWLTGIEFVSPAPTECSLSQAATFQ